MGGKFPVLGEAISPSGFKGKMRKKAEEAKKYNSKSGGFE
jgi:hypothetical protein